MTVTPNDRMFPNTLEVSGGFLYTLKTLFGQLGAALKTVCLFGCLWGVRVVWRDQGGFFLSFEGVSYPDESGRKRFEG